jgi:hypothetical protein
MQNERPIIFLMDGDVLLEKAAQGIAAADTVVIVRN